jgi:hypothetical protein
MLANLTCGVFADPIRMSDLVVRFCERYERALASPVTCPAPWRIAFEAAEAAPDRTIRNLVLGASAHMSYDLCAVIVERLVDDDTADLERDVQAINDVIDRGIVPVQRALASRSASAGVLAGLGGGIDVLVTWQTFRRWRHRAWLDALAIAARKSTLARVEARVAARATWLARLPI